MDRFTEKWLHVTLTYSMDQSPSWEANRLSASQEILLLLWNPKVHYRIHNSPPPVSILSHLDTVHTPTSTSWRSILILSSHLSLGVQNDPFPSRFPTKTLYTTTLHTIRPTCTTHLILLDFISQKILGEEYRSLRSSLCSFLHSLVTSSLLHPNILLNTLFSNIRNLRSSLNVNDQVSLPYKTIGKIIYLYVSMSIFLDSKLENKRFCTEKKQAFLDCKLILISSRIEVWFVKAVQIYFNSSTLSKEPLSVFILWLRPAFWSWGMSMFLVLSAFTSIAVSLLAPTKVSAFFFILRTLRPNILTSSA